MDDRDENRDDENVENTRGMNNIYFYVMYYLLPSLVHNHFLYFIHVLFVDANIYLCRPISRRPQLALG